MAVNLPRKVSIKYGLDSLADGPFHTVEEARAEVERHRKEAESNRAEMFRKDMQPRDMQPRDMQPSEHIPSAEEKSGLGPPTALPAPKALPPSASSLQERSITLHPAPKDPSIPTPRPTNPPPVPPKPRDFQLLMKPMPKNGK